MEFKINRNETFKDDSLLINNESQNNYDKSKKWLNIMRLGHSPPKIEYDNLDNTEDYKKIKDIKDIKDINVNIKDIKDINVNINAKDLKDINANINDIKDIKDIKDINEEDIYKNVEYGYPIMNMYPNRFNYKEIICLNCNIAGHIQKKCRYPINSYGIILYKIKSSDINIHNINQYLVKFLIIQRKFSYSFISLLLGKYYEDDIPYNMCNNIFDINKLIDIVKNIPLTERYSIKIYDFKYLWSNVWTWQNCDNINNSKKYLEAEQKFNLFKKLYIYLFDEYPTNKIEPDWEFPKGRRIIGESNIQCAIRECIEETGIQPENIYDKKVFHEKFTGSNGIEYCNNYYISEVTNNNLPIYYDYDQVSQNSEIRKIGWFNIENAIKLLHNSEYKRKLLYGIIKILKK